MRRYVGLDLHKRSVAVCILDEQGQRLWRGKVDCGREALLAFARQRLTPEDHVAMEATTNTWAVLELLEPHVAEVVVGNPMKTKAIAESSIKTDKVDAEVLAQLLRCGYLPTVWHPDKSTRRLRKLTTMQATLTKEQTRVKNRIHAVLAQLLITPPMATLFSQAGLKWLAQLELPADDRLAIDMHLQRLEAVQQQIAEVEAKLAELAHADPSARLLMTLPGFNFACAQALLAALGELSRFNDGDHAASYLGLVPATRQSANHCHHGRITKAGRTHARWMLTQAAQHAGRHPGPLGVFFRRLARRKGRNVAVTATARKLVTIAFLMLKHNEPYRYALPEPTQRKLADLDRRVGARKRRYERVEGLSRQHREPGTRVRNIRSLPQVYEREGLPAAREPMHLPRGERRMLNEHGVEEHHQRIQSPQQRISRRRS